MVLSSLLLINWMILLKDLCNLFPHILHGSLRSTPVSLTHWGRMTHICVGKLTIVGSENGLLPARRQAIIWTNAGILLNEPSGTNLSEILIRIITFSFTKIRLKVSSAKRRPFCLSLNVLNDCSTFSQVTIMMTSWYGKPFLITAPLWITPPHKNSPHKGQYKAKLWFLCITSDLKCYDAYEYITVILKDIVGSEVNVINMSKISFREWVTLGQPILSLWQKIQHPADSVTIVIVQP